MKPHDVILLLQSWTRRLFVLDLRETDVYKEWVANSTITSSVHHVSEPACTTDVCMDSMTVVPTNPVSNTVQVIPGRIQWFGNIIELTEPMESPVLPAYSTADCDPSIVNPVRWSLLYMRKDTFGENKLLWAHGTPNGEYPDIPFQGVPLALVQTPPGIPQITTEDILNWRSIRPGYAPSAKHFYPPVDTVADLMSYDDPFDGAQCLVIEEGVIYYYYKGAWRRVADRSFDNTSFVTDVTVFTQRVDLPWVVSNPVELVVFRDGMFMCLDKDYRVVMGSSSYLLFNYNLAPGQRVIVVRNPFFAQAFGGDDSGGGGGGGGGGVDPSSTLIEIWVDGDIGNDLWEGSEVSPYKTLQRGLDVIARVSNNTYIVHAKNLKLADALQPPDSDNKVFGYAINKVAASIRLDIEDSYEWDSSMSYVYYMNHVGAVFYKDQTVEYPFILVDCNSSFHNTVFHKDVAIYGGTAYFDTCVGDSGTDVLYITVYSGCIAQIVDSNFKYFRITVGTLVTAYRSEFQHLVGWHGGIFRMYYGKLSGTVSFSNSMLDLYYTEVYAHGDFIGGVASCTSLKFDGSGDLDFPLFFNCQQGATLGLYDCRFNKLPTSVIKATGNCVLDIDSCKFVSCSNHAVWLAHGTSALFKKTDFSSNSFSGVHAEYHCTLYFVDCTGDGNMLYGCECYDLSRAEFSGSLIRGVLGMYYELIPGADTVISKRDTDTVPGTLEEKITVGQGLKTSIQPSDVPGDYKFHVEVDVDELVGSGGVFGSALISIQPKMTVFERRTAIPEPPAVGHLTEVNSSWPGQSYMSSVTRRIFNPTVQTKHIDTIKVYQEHFTEEDKWNGTTMLDDGVTLVDFPALGYRVNQPHFFFSNYDGLGAITSYGISTLSGFTVDADVPAGTSVKVAFSVNGSSLWRTWDNVDVEWKILFGDSTLIQMQGAPEYTEVMSWPSLAWDRLRQLAGQYITVCFLLSTTSTVLTPKVKSYEWTYTEDGFLEDITEYFDRRYYNSRAVFAYRGGLGTVDPPVFFSIMPTTHRA